MKTFTVSLLSTMLLASAAMALSLPGADSINPNEAKLKTCIAQEAQAALVKGVLTKDNIDNQAAKIAANCATKAAVKNDSATLNLATTVIKGLLK